MNEAIVIGDSVELVVLSVKGNRVRLGVLAPRDIPIRRTEIQPRKEQQLEQEQETKCP